MSEEIHIRLSDAQNTISCGISLSRTLYDPLPTVLLTGPLGAGKTTFMQGFAQGLGITQPVTSPTFALEQRYQTEHHGELLHLDLYRLSPAQAQELVAQTDDHSGLRCIEWADRLPGPPSGPSITMAFAEDPAKPEERTLSVTFADLSLPSPEQVTQWRQEFMLPEHIQRHCDAVGQLSEEFAQQLIARGEIARPLALRRTGELHDLLRFVDFKVSNAKEAETPAQRDHWQAVKEQYPEMKHEAACAAFLREQGYAGAAEIIATHGINLPPSARRTTEQKILYYADKRVQEDQVVSLQERFDDFCARYGGGTHSPQSRAWLEEARTLERELLLESENH